MCIAIVCFPCCDVMTKRSRQKLKYTENEKSFYGEIKSIFHHLKAFQSPQIVSHLRVCLKNRTPSRTFSNFFEFEVFRIFRISFLWNSSKHLSLIVASNMVGWKFSFMPIVLYWKCDWLFIHESLTRRNQHVSRHYYSSLNISQVDPVTVIAK